MKFSEENLTVMTEIKKKKQVREYRSRIQNTLSTNLHVCFTNIFHKEEYCVQ